MHQQRIACDVEDQPELRQPLQVEPRPAVIQVEGQQREEVGVAEEGVLAGQVVAEADLAAQVRDQQLAQPAPLVRQRHAVDDLQRVDHGDDGNGRSQRQAGDH